MLMKRISTHIYNLTLLFSLFTVAFSASAEEYKSMIRYDRVWEHISVNWNNKAVFYTKFDGAEEINGKTYHRLVSFRKARYDYDKDGQCYLFDLDENYLEHEGYLREEDGKVYTLVAINDSETVFPRIDLYTPEYKDNAVFRLEEKVLYDFTCREGESYRGLHLHHTWGKEINYTVKSIDTVEIDGENHRRLRAYPEGYDDCDEPMVEGIGISSYGCLTTFNILDQPSCPCLDYIFNRVISTDGTVIYQAGRGSDNIPLDGFLGVDAISQPFNNNAPIYDMLGRHLTSPAPGQLYIQGGKKYIAK